MRKIKILAAVLALCAVEPLCIANADGISKVTVMTSDGENVSLKNTFGGEVKKSIDGLLDDTEENEQPHEVLSNVLTIRSESTDMAVSDIYIRISADKKKTVKNAKVEITNSYGNKAEELKVSKADGCYTKDYYLGSFNSKSEFDTRMYTIVASGCEDVEFEIVYVSENDNSYVEDEANSNIRTVGNGKGEILPGEYRLTTSKQVKITAADGKVSMFKASGTRGETVILNEGDAIEFFEDVYLVTASFDFEKCLHLLSEVLIQDVPGYYTEICNGTVSVYDENGELRYSAAASYISDNVAYKLNCGGVEREDEQQTVGVGTIKINEEIEYTVGTDIGVGNYTATGEGTVRVYDGDGYLKSVIRLKKDSSDKTGVDSYVFKLGEGEVFITEGNIKFKQTDN